MNRAYACALFLLCAATAIASPAQTFTTLVSFDRTDGAAPQFGPLVQGRDGNFYGTTSADGANATNVGTVFKITPSGTLTTLYNFCAQTNCTDGANPYAGLVLGTDGNFYGTTYAGGANGTNVGTVFKITPSGTLTTLHSFDYTDGANPYAGLVQATDGNFYGTTSGGGANGLGTVFKITPGGTLRTLYSFAFGADGYSPEAGLVQATDGNFYGTTFYGGNGGGNGTVFKITPGGTVTALHGFGGFDGDSPAAGLVQATNGNFYGTTSYAGANCLNEFECGTVFKITPSGTLTTLYTFCSQTNCTDGYNPLAALVQATDGNFYGTTAYGGDPTCFAPYGCGTVFKITPTDTLTTPHSFNGTDGSAPIAGLMQATNGNLYGTTSGGGANGVGTVFTLSVGLGPFVEALTYSGKVGKTIEFLGQGFTSTTTVSFNGHFASRTVVSGTYLTATVPSGATTGFVTVTTSGGTLKSNKIFRVIPQITSFSPTSGPVGTVVTIKGVSLSQTTTVTFGGVKAIFTKVNDTTVTATVPSGAKTGKIGVTTLGGTATSAATFTIT
jgi:uncharacterized repeat protein (TIGR03803 family)